MLLLGTLAACGGGGSVERESTTGAAGGSGGSVTRAIQLDFVDENAQSSISLTAANPLTLVATVTDSTGAAVTDTLITYAFQPEGLAVFANDSGTATTGSDGIAIVAILVGANSGAGQITATLSSGETNTTTFNSQGTAQVNTDPASLDLFASSIQLASSGSDQIELLALVKNANNVLLEGINVTYSADSGANLQLATGGSVAVTGADGIARATLNTLNQPANRTIIISASAAGLTAAESLDIQVVGTQVTIIGSSSVIINDPVPLTVNLVDSDGTGIANQQVTLSSTLGTLSDNSPVTSTAGQVTVDYTASAAGTDLITATALNAVGSFTMVIQQDDFSFSTVPVGPVELDTNTNIVIRWLKNDSAFANGQVTLTSSRGTITSASASTDGDGLVSFSMQSGNAGIASVTANGIDGDGNQVSASTQIEFVASVAATILVDGTPDSVGPNGQTSTITAVLRDPNGNLVKGKVINFMVDDVSGGTISPNQGTTNSSGIASTVYTSNAVSTFEAVSISATVADTPSVMAITNLTVGDKAFDISIGTGRLINSDQSSYYAKEFSIFVTDPNSNPVTNAFMTFSAPPVKFTDGGVFYKGFWVYNEGDAIWQQMVTATCANEDIDGNGILDAGEDINNDQQLTPGNIVTIPASGTTDVNGQVLIDIRYGKQFGAWTEVDIEVKAESVGTESSESQTFSLPVSAEDLTVPGSGPPDSPYGLSVNCNDTF
jgi:hypothetical protein